MPQLERKLSRYAAPLLLTAAALGFNACNQDGPKQPNPSPEPTPAMTGGIPAEATQEAPSPEDVGNTTLVSHNTNEYELFTGITINDILKTANSLPESNSKEALIDTIQGAISLQNISPTHEGIVPSLNRAFNILGNNCDGDTEKEIAKEIVSYSRENFPYQYDANSRLYEQGPCSVTEEVQVNSDNKVTTENAKIVRIEKSPPSDILPRGSHTITTIRGQYEYTYKLIADADPKIVIPNVRGLISESGLNSYIADTGKRSEITDKYNDALNKANLDPHDPQIIERLMEASSLLKSVCTTKMHRIIMYGNASMVYFLDPQSWKVNQIFFIDSDCFDVQKREITP